MKNNETKLESLILEEFELYKKEKELLNEIRSPFAVARGIRNFFSRGRTSVKLFRVGSDLYKSKLDDILSKARTRRNNSSLTLEEIEQEAIDFLYSIGYRAPGEIAGLAKSAQVFSDDWIRTASSGVFGKYGARYPGRASELLDKKANELLDAIMNVKLTVLEQGKSLEKVLQNINSRNIPSPPKEVYDFIDLHALYFGRRTAEIEKLLTLFNQKTPGGRKNIFNFFLRQSDINPGITTKAGRSQRERVEAIRKKFVGASDDAAAAGGSQAGKTTGKSADKAQKGFFRKLASAAKFPIALTAATGLTTQAIATVVDYVRDRDPLELAKEIEKTIIRYESFMYNLVGPTPYLSATLGWITKWSLTFILGNYYTRGFLGLQAAQDIALAEDGVLSSRKAMKAAGGLTDADALEVYKWDRTPQADYEFSSVLFRQLYLISIGDYLRKLKASRSRRDDEAIEAIANKEKKRIREDLFVLLKKIKQRWEREVQPKLDSGSSLKGDVELVNEKWNKTMQGIIDGTAQASKMFSTERIYSLFEKQAGLLNIEDAEEEFIKGIKKEFKSIRRKKPKELKKIPGVTNLPSELTNFEERMVAVRYKMIHDRIFPLWQGSDLYAEDDVSKNIELEDFMFPTTSITKSKKGSPERVRYVEEANEKSEKIAMIINSILERLGFTAAEYVNKLELLAILPDRADDDPFYTQDPMKYLKSIDNLGSDEVAEEVLSRIDSGALNKQSIKNILSYVRIMIPLATGRGWGKNVHPAGAPPEVRKKAKERTKEAMDKQEKFVESSYRKLFKEMDRFSRRLIKMEIEEANQNLNDFAQDVRKIYQEIVEKQFNIKWESK